MVYFQERFLVYKKYLCWLQKDHIINQLEFNNKFELINKKEILALVIKEFKSFYQEIEQLVEWDLVEYKKTYWNKFLKYSREYQLTPYGELFELTKNKAVDDCRTFMDKWNRL